MENSPYNSLKYLTFHDLRRIFEILKGFVVSVTDTNGAGVARLAIGNFAIGSEIVGPGGSTCHVGSVANGKLTGTYLLNVLPYEGQTWKGGVHIFSVNATSGADKGQTLCSFLMD